MDTITKKYIAVFRCEKTEKSLSMFPWNKKMKQFVYFPSQDQFKQAFKWCAYHIAYDVCADRLDFMGTPFSGIRVISAEFSQDEKKLLLVTQESKPYENDKTACLQLFDLEKGLFIYKTYIPTNQLETTALSPNGSKVACLSTEGQLSTLYVSSQEDDVTEITRGMKTLCIINP